MGAGSWALLAGGGWNNPVSVTTSKRIVTERSLPMNAVSESFFAALGSSIVQGRNFTSMDAQPGWDLRTAIVNQEFVDQYMAGESPIGALLGIGNGPDVEPNIEIVGVVSSFQQYGLREPEPQIFFSLWERTVGTATFYVR